MRGLIFALGIVVSVSGRVQAAAPVEDARQTHYSDISAELKQLAQAAPQSTKLFTLGVSDSGENIYGIKIGNGTHRDLVVATHHGNEYGSTEVARALARDLIQNPISTETVYVIPVLNISGYNAKIREERDAHGNFIDPNRDYLGPCKLDQPFLLKSTAALAQFVDQEKIVTSATLHTFQPAVVYPWGISTDDVSTRYDALYTALANAAAYLTHYPTGNSTQLIYPADGAYEDYVFWKHGVWSLLFELGHSHYPSADDISDMVKGNVPGLRAMFVNAPASRAVDHNFEGKCSDASRRLDRHDE